ncbi:unnamed protein product [Boreogadus saida]
MTQTAEHGFGKNGTSCQLHSYRPQDSSGRRDGEHHRIAHNDRRTHSMGKGPGNHHIKYQHPCSDLRGTRCAPSLSPPGLVLPLVLKAWPLLTTDVVIDGLAGWGHVTDGACATLHIKGDKHQHPGILKYK